MAMKRLKARFGRPRETSATPKASEGAGVGHLPSSQLPPLQTCPSPVPENNVSDVFGVKVLHDCPDATVDVCFIHGLTGDREGTWIAPGQPTPWPGSLLPLQLSRARILTYGYDAYIVRKSAASMNRLADHARNLLTDLTTCRWLSNASSRPLIFVAHSLGGLVCKNAVLISRNCAEHHLRDIFHCTKGIAFLGTPHKGSWMAKWAKIPAAGIGLLKSTNRSLLDILSTDNEFLEAIQSDFWGMIREQREGGRPLEVTCFFEELPLPVVGTVVPKESATLEGYTGISIYANHRDMVRFASPEVSGYKRLVGELVRWQAQTAQLLPQSVSEDLTECLQSLAFPQMQDRYHDIDHALPGTCQWLLQHKIYTDWIGSHRGLLWIKGKPGSGKSTLLKYALRHLEKVIDMRSNLIFSFFCHGRGDKLQRTPNGLFRSLLHQALGQSPNSLQDIVNTFRKRCNDNGEPNIKWHWHPNELYDFFKSCLPRLLATRTTWLFVDALDECGESSAVQLAEQFKSLLQSLPSEGFEFRIFFTCRHYPILDPYCNLEISLEEENSKDISTYVYSQLSAFSKENGPVIPELIIGRASGVFMWVRIVVYRVLDLDRHGVGLRKIEEAVRSIVPDLDALYLQLFRGMGLDSLKLMQWICCASRPLTMVELQWAMAVEADCFHPTPQECLTADEYISGTGSLKRQIQTLSCGLAEIVSTQWGEVVQFIHQSVKEFCFKKGLLAIDRNFITSEKAIGLTQLRLSRICLRYLDMVEISQQGHKNRKGVNLESNFPFLNYATTSWAAHLEEADARPILQEEFLKYTWVPVKKLRRYSELLHVLSKFQTTRLLKAVLGINGLVVDSKNDKGETPLYLAAECGNEPVFRMLLETQMVDVNSKGSFGRTPLWWLCYYNMISAVQKLLEDPRIDVNSKDEHGWTPLWCACRYGRYSIIRLLLQNPKVDVNSKDNGGRTPLFWACGYNEESVVKLLLKAPKIDVGVTNNNGKTSFSLANTSIQEMLLQKLSEAPMVNID